MPKREIKVAGLVASLVAIGCAVGVVLLGLSFLNKYNDESKEKEVSQSSVSQVKLGGEKYSGR